MQLVLEHQLAGDDFGAGRSRNERARTVVLESIILKLRGVAPEGVLECGADRCRHQRELLARRSEAVLGVGLDDASLAMSHHVVQ